MLSQCHNYRIVRLASFCFRTWPCVVMLSELLPIWIETSARTRVTRTAFTCFIPRGGTRKWQMLFWTTVDTIAVNILPFAFVFVLLCVSFVALVSMLMWYLFMVFVAVHSWLGDNKKRRTSSTQARTVGLRYCGAFGFIFLLTRVRFNSAATEYKALRSVWIINIYLVIRSW